MRILFFYAFIQLIIMNYSSATASVLSEKAFISEFADSSFSYIDIYDRKKRVASYYRNGTIKIFEKKRLYGKGRWWLKSNNVCSSYGTGRVVCGKYHKIGKDRFRTSKGFILHRIDRF